MLDVLSGDTTDRETGPALDLLTPARETWYQHSTAVSGYSPEDYWFCVEGYIEERRYLGGLRTPHFFACSDGTEQPYFPDVFELQTRHVDIEILARQLWDGISAELFGKALEAEGSGSRLNTVMKIGTVAEVNAWMERVIARKAESAAAQAASSPT